MEPLELARRVEASEISAYRSLVGISKRTSPAPLALDAVSLGSAVVLVAPAMRTPLPFNRVIGLGVCEEATEHLVNEASTLYERHGVGFAIEVAPHARPNDLVAWLRARRMRRATSIAVHARRAERLDPPGVPVRVERAGRELRDTVADLCCSVLGMPDLVRDLIAASSGQPGWRHWLAYIDDAPVAAALSFVDGDAAWLGWAATRPASRGRGAHAALVAARVSDAADAGCNLVSTETAVSTAERPDPSFKSFERTGFRVAYERATYVAMRAGAGRRAGGGSA